MSQRNLITNFNASPFYDDFDEAKKFLRILFRPAYPVQARELTQLQTILSNQVSKFGSSVYKDGTTVSGGDLSLTDTTSITLPSTITFTDNLTKLLSQSDTGTGYQVNDQLLLRYGATDKLIATLGNNNTLTYTLVDNVTPAGFFGKVSTENYSVTTGAQNAQFEINTKVTTSTTPASFLTIATGTYTVGETVTQTHADSTTATAEVAVLDADGDAYAAGTNLPLVTETITGTFDTLTNVVGGTSTTSRSVTTVSVDDREESPVFKVQGFTTATTTDASTIFGIYETGTEFITGDEIRLMSDGGTVSTDSLGTLAAGFQTQSQVISVKEGVFYTNGFFVSILQQSIPLNKYDRDNTARIGFDVGESTVTEIDDPTLLDNASGASNENAACAHRFKLDLTLAYKPVLATNDDINNTSDIAFYQIGKIEDGTMVDVKLRKTQSAFDKEIAKRIADIQGNFIVDPFLLTYEDKELFTVDPRTATVGATVDHESGASKLRVKASLTTLTASDFAGRTLTVAGNMIPLKIVSAVQNPDGNVPASSYADIFDLTLEDVDSGNVGGVVPSWLSLKDATATMPVVDPDNYQAVFGVGHAYVDGFRFKTIEPTKIDIEKTTTTQHISDPFTFSQTVSHGNFIPTLRVSGELELTDFAFGKHVLFYSQTGGAYSAGTSSTNANVPHGGADGLAIGSARVKQLRRNDGSTTAWGTSATDGQLEVYFWDMKFGTDAINPAGTALTNHTRTVSDTDDMTAGNYDGVANTVVNTAGQAVVQFASLGTAAVTASGATFVISGVGDVLAIGDVVHCIDNHYYKVLTRTDANTVTIGAVSGGTVHDSNQDGLAFRSNEHLVGSTFIANGVRYRVKLSDFKSNQITLTSNLQEEIADDTVLTFQFDATNIKSIRFNTTAANGAIYSTSSTAESTNSIDSTYSDTIIQEPDKKRLIFPISDSIFESIKNTTHRYMKTADLTTSGAGVATPSLTTSNGTESIVPNLSEVIAVLASNGNHIDATAITSATITFGETSTAIRVSFPVQRTSIPSGAFDGDLSIPNDFIFGNTVTVPTLLNGGNSFTSGYIDYSEGQVILPADTFAEGAIDSNGKPNFKRLGLTGVARVQKIYEVPDDDTSTSKTIDGDFVDRSADFDVDYGQNDMIVDHAKIRLRNGKALPTATKRILVIVDRVKTTSTSDGANLFYTANSYPDIYYSLLDNVYASDRIVERLEAIDFRPRVVETAEATNPLTVGEHSLTFTDTATVPHAANSNLLTGQITNYVGRKDTALITSDYGLEVVQGSPDRVPNSPEPDERSLVLYDINLPPHILGSIDISTVGHNHDLYQMQDIARMDKRLQEVEKTVQLDSIEKNVLATEVNDKNNTNLFKTGVLVDSFKNFGVADVEDPNFNAAIDKGKGQLRPAPDTYCFSLEYDDVTGSTAERTDEDVLLAPLNTSTPKVAVISNVVASRIENLNPFAVATYEGTLRLYATKDFWKSKTIKSVNTNVANENDAYAKMKRNNPTRIDWSGEVKGVTWSGVKVDRTSATQKAENKKIRDAKAVNFLTFGLGFLLGGFANPYSYKKVKYNMKEGGRGSETGTKQTIELRHKKTLTKSRVVDSSVIPYMRNPRHGGSVVTTDSYGDSKARQTRAGIHFNADGMRPSTTLFPFFDEVNIMEYIRPAIILKVSNTSANKTIYNSIRAGSGKGGPNFFGAKERSRAVLTASGVSSDDQKCILANKSKDASFLYYHVIPPTRDSALYDKRKELLTTVTVGGNTITLAGLIRPKQAGALRLKTDPTGSVGGVFVVPVTTFATGTRLFKLTDTSSGDVSTAKTFAEQNFESSGVKMKIHNTYVTTRVPVVKRVTVGRQTTIYR